MRQTCIYSTISTDTVARGTLSSTTSILSYCPCHLPKISWAGVALEVTPDTEVEEGRTQLRGPETAYQRRFLSVFLCFQAWKKPAQWRAAIVHT